MGSRWVNFRRSLSEITLSSSSSTICVSVSWVYSPMIRAGNGPFFVEESCGNKSHNLTMLTTLITLNMLNKLNMLNTLIAHVMLHPHDVEKSQSQSNLEIHQSQSAISFVDNLKCSFRSSFRFKTTRFRADSIDTSRKKCNAPFHSRFYTPRGALTYNLKSTTPQTSLIMTDNSTHTYTSNTASLSFSSINIIRSLHSDRFRVNTLSVTLFNSYASHSLELRRHSGDSRKGLMSECLGRLNTYVYTPRHNIYQQCQT